MKRMIIPSVAIVTLSLFGSSQNAFAVAGCTNDVRFKTSGGAWPTSVKVWRSLSPLDLKYQLTSTEISSGWSGSQLELNCIVQVTYASCPGSSINNPIWGVRRKDPGSGNGYDSGTITCPAFPGGNKSVFFKLTAYTCPSNPLQRPHLDFAFEMSDNWCNQTGPIRMSVQHVELQTYLQELKNDSSPRAQRDAEVVEVILQQMKTDAENNRSPSGLKKKMEAKAILQQIRTTTQDE